MASFRSFRIGWTTIVALVSTAIASIANVEAATLIVTTTADSGPGSLRDTIAAAGSGDVIQFDPALNGQTIVLTSGALSVGSGITIEGPGPSLLTVQRAFNAPSFSVFAANQCQNGVTISGLTIANGEGGIVIGSFGCAPVMIANCNIIDNSGAGVFCSSGVGQNRVTITNSTISGNTGDYGGGIYNAGPCLCIAANACNMTIINTTVSGNSATQGGGIYSGGVLTVTNSTISGNAASPNQSGGGGIANGGTMTLMNSTVSGNSAYHGGGILYFPANTPLVLNELTLINSTITANLATEGGGVYSDVTGSVGHTRNSIIALNVAPSGPDIHGEMISEGFNLVGTNSGADISPVQLSDQIGTPGSPIDPLLGPLQDNGGPTFTHALFPGSPAIDQGESSGSSTDQRGFVRPVDFPDIQNVSGGDGADIGAVESAAATLANISTRLRVETGDNSMIGGFIITGTEPKTVIVRGIGPSLPVSEALADPVIEVHGASGELLATNDNWASDPNSQHVIDSGLAPHDNLESALWGIINPGAYTVVVRGKNDATGIGLFEVYDLDQTANSRLGNVSTRGLVGIDNNVMVGGTIIVGTHPVRVLVRAIGPSLTNFGVPNPLPDPTLELHDGNGALLFSNDNWRSDQEAEIIATGILPSNDLESAIVEDLAPGNYTAIVRGVSNTTGNAVVEAYELN